VRTEGRAADPHLLITPSPGDVGVQLTLEGGVHREDGPAVETLGQFERGLHRGDVADDLARVVLVGAAQLG